MWAVTGAVWDLIACMHAAHALCGLLRPLCSLLQPLCGLSLAKTGKEEREKRQETKIGNEDRE